MKKVLVSMFLLMSFGIFQKGYAIENIVSLDEVAPKTDQASVQTSTSVPLEASVSFDWLDIPQAQRNDQISKYENLLFDQKDSNIYFSKDEFKSEIASYKKDKSFKLHYMLTNNGITEDEDAKYCAFYYKNKTLVVYAIQYKNNPTRAFYYTVFGKLVYTDMMSKEYPNFPYTSMQYDRHGNLKSAIYFISKDFQYMYGPDKEFQGVWYKDKMYDKNGKQTITRSNW